MIYLDYNKKRINVELNDNTIKYFKIDKDNIIETVDGSIFRLISEEDKYYIGFCQTEKIQLNGVPVEENSVIALSEQDVLRVGKKMIYIYQKEWRLERQYDVKLPFSLPKYCTYPQFTSILSILAGYKRDIEWIFNNYILLWADKYIVSESYWADFKYASEDVEEEFCPMILKHYRGKYDDKDIIALIKFYIDNKMYFYVSVDMFFIDAWWGEGEERFHFVHQIFIFGYNDREKEFIVADFFKNHYQIKRVSYDSFERAYSANECGNSAIEKLYSGDILFKYQSVEYSIDLKRVGGLMNDFICGTDTTLYNYLNICRTDMVVYGIEFIDKIEKYVKECKAQNKTLDIRPFQLLYQMNMIMHERMLYFHKHGLVVLDDETMLQIENAEILSRKIRDNALKISALKINKVYGRLIEQLEVFKNSEKYMIKRCYQVITNEEIFGGDKCTKKVKTKCWENTYENLELFFETKEKIESPEKAFELLNSYGESNFEGEIYSHYYYNVLPFETELRGEKRLGTRLINFEGRGSQAIYKKSNDGNVRLHCHVTDEFFDYSTYTVMLYQYEENQTVRYAFCYDCEIEDFRLRAVCICKKRIGDEQEFCEINKNSGKYTFGYFVYEGGKIVRRIVFREEYHESLSAVKKTNRDSFKNLFYYNECGDIKQIVREDWYGGKKNIYPRYGAELMDYNYLKTMLIETVKTDIFVVKEPLQSIVCEINLNDSEVLLGFEWDNGKTNRRLIPFMKGYCKDSNFHEKISFTVKETIHVILKLRELMMKEKTKDFAIEYRCYPEVETYDIDSKDENIMFFKQ